MLIKVLEKNSLETLKETAIEKLDFSAEEIKKWAGRVRPDDGKAARGVYHLGIKLHSSPLVYRIIYNV